MPDRPDAVVLLGATVGATVVGPTVVTIDDDCLTIGVADAADGAWTVRVETIVAVAPDAGGVTLRLRDGKTIVLHSADGPTLSARLRAVCRRVPELTRALRAMGSRRRNADAAPGDDGNARAEGLFFAPFLAARRAAAETADAAAIVGAFDAVELRHAVQQTVEQAIRGRTQGNPALRRALEAQGEEILEPLTAALGVLGSFADQLRRDLRQNEANTDLLLWRAWGDALRAVFKASDRAWADVDRLLAAHPLAAPVPARRATRR